MILPLGDRAFLARFATEDEARSWGTAAREAALPGVIDVVVAYAAVAIYIDPDRADPDALERAIRAIAPGEFAAHAAPLHEIPTLYDGEDLAEIAATRGVSIEAVIAAHAGCEYVIQAIGFLPGFPYAGDLPDLLRGLPRRARPRVRVPTGSVAIAGRQTGLYPRESPGGWNLLGRTPLQVVDLAAGHFPLRTGDRLRFVPIDRREFDARVGERLGGVIRSGIGDGRPV